jgi:hypothetical protein
MQSSVYNIKLNPMQKRRNLVWAKAIRKRNVEKYGEELTELSDPERKKQKVRTNRNNPD